MFLSSVQAFDTAGTQTAKAMNGMTSSLFMFGAIFVVFYFLLIRPQQKERKRHQEMLDTLKAGDKIVTNGGIIGTLHSITDESVQVKVCEKVKITMLRSAIRGLEDAPDESRAN